MTNYEKIKLMNQREMESLLLTMQCSVCSMDGTCPIKNRNQYLRCKKSIAKWLISEVD